MLQEFLITLIFLEGTYQYHSLVLLFLTPVYDTKICATVLHRMLQAFHAYSLF
jgi:hypothetical protein